MLSRTNYYLNWLVLRIVWTNKYLDIWAPKKFVTNHTTTRQRLHIKIDLHSLTQHNTIIMYTIKNINYNKTFSKITECFRYLFAEFMFINIKTLMWKTIISFVKETSLHTSGTGISNFYLNHNTSRHPQIFIQYGRAVRFQTFCWTSKNMFYKIMTQIDKVAF